jgi:hypothetical protein
VFHALNYILDWYLPINRDIGNLLSLLKLKLPDRVVNVKVELLHVHQFMFLALKSVLGQHHFLLLGLGLQAVATHLAEHLEVFDSLGRLLGLIYVDVHL